MVQHIAQAVVEGAAVGHPPIGVVAEVIPVQHAGAVRALVRGGAPAERRVGVPVVVLTARATPRAGISAMGENKCVDAAVGGDRASAERVAARIPLG